MLSDGIRLIGDGLLDVAEERLQGLLVSEDINEVYEVEQTPFARGKFAAVRRAVHKSSGVHFAAKFLRRRRRAQSSDKEIKHEIAVLILCSGAENIVKLNAVHETRSDTALLLELATGGELQAILDDEGSLTEAQARFCMRQVLKALQFLHKRSIAHLDLKPQNILLAGKRVEDGLKLCDFGISRVIENGSKIREILGTPDYVAPEVLQYDPLSLQTDIWSVGVLTYVLLTGCTPFGGDTKQETFLNISQCSLTFPDELFKDVSEDAIDFIKSTLRIKPDDRLTTLECLEHIWLKDESPNGSTYLTMSSSTSRRESFDQKSEKDLKNAKCDDNEIKMAATTTINGCGDRYKSDIEIDNRSHQKYTSTRLTTSNNDADDHHYDDNNEHDKENFLINSSSTLNNVKSCSPSIYNLQKYGHNHDHVKFNAQSKLCNGASPTITTTSKLTNCGKYLNMESNNGSSSSSSSNSNSLSSSSCSASLKHLHNNGLNETDYVRNCLDKIRSPQQSTVSTTITTAAAICLFPDAPTTPKVIRKTPSETARSVKALVKKFQLETDDAIVPNATAMPAATNLTPPTSLSPAVASSSSSSSTTVSTIKQNDQHIEDEFRTAVDSNNHNNISSSSSSSNSNNFKSTCVFCLTCGGPGCRHSGRTTVSKSSGNLGMDQGIIC